MHNGRWWLGSVLVGLAGLPPLLAVQDAWRTDGRHVRGTLTVEGGRLRFTPGSNGEPVPLTDLERIHFGGDPPSPIRKGGGRRVLLHDGQQITGRLLHLDKDTLSLQTAWAPRLDLPRGAIAAVTSLPGWRTLVEEDFRAGLQGFRTTGEPNLTAAPADNGARSVVLEAVGQGVIYTPQEALTAGRVGINFQEQGQPSGARWTFEVVFQDKERSRHLAVEVAGTGEHYQIDAGGWTGTSRKVARGPGWHRLVVQFTTRSLRVTCDDDVLWYNLEQGPGGAARQVALHCRPSPASTAAPRGSVAWTEFCLERGVAEPPSRLGRADQDAVCLLSGDQLFGHILQADRRVLQLWASFGERGLPWVGVQGCSFQWTPIPPQITEGPHVRLRLRSGLAADADVLEGVATGLDERCLTFRHARLGELQIEQGWIQELRPIFHGKRFELSTGFHHLGPRGEVANLPLPRAEGLSWQGQVRLEAEPSDARLIVHVLGLSAGDAPRKETLQEERGQTEVIVNERRVDYLNRQMQRAGSSPRRLVVELHRGTLKAGDNVIEVRQTLDPASKRHSHCGLFGLALEVLQ